jgi:eukaryotic-like serine/threonine-protein kinase
VPTIARKQVKGGWLVSITGAIDESFKTSDLGTDVGGIVVIDLGGVTRITSFGVRNWTESLRALKAKELFFINCSPTMISGFNMISNFGGDGKVVTFVAPYHCDECNKDIDILIDLRTNGAALLGNVPSVRCPACGGAAEFDDVPSGYLSFARAQGRPNVSSAVEPIIAAAPRRGNTS